MYLRAVLIMFTVFPGVRIPTENASHYVEHIQRKMVLQHAATLGHPAPRCLHSQKSVSGRVLPTTSKCSGIAQNENLTHSYMFMDSYHHSLLIKRGANVPLAVLMMAVVEVMERMPALLLLLPSLIYSPFFACVDFVFEFRRAPSTNSIS